MTCAPLRNAISKRLAAVQRLAPDPNVSPHQIASLDGRNNLSLSFGITVLQDGAQGSSYHLSQTSPALLSLDVLQDT